MRRKLAGALAALALGMAVSGQAMAACAQADLKGWWQWVFILTDLDGNEASAGHGYCEMKLNDKGHVIDKFGFCWWGWMTSSGDHGAEKESTSDGLAPARFQVKSNCTLYGNWDEAGIGVTTIKAGRLIANKRLMMGFMRWGSGNLVGSANFTAHKR